MKRTLLFIACVLTSFTMMAQDETNEYLPFVEIGKQWHVVSNPTNPYVPCRFERFEMKDEEEHDGKTYIHTYRINDEQGTNQDEGLFREENRRVYKYEGGRDVLLYDFSLKEGDTFIYEYGILDEPTNCKVLKQGWLEDGPNIQMLDSLTPEGAWTFKYRKLRTWTIGVDNGSGGFNEATTWIEGVGTLINTFIRPYATGYMSCLAYIYRIDRSGDNDYLPFSLCNMYGPVYGSDLPTGSSFNTETEDRRHQLTYELEGDRLHIYGDVFCNCGPNNYAYFIEGATDDPLVRKVYFEIQGVEPLMWCEGLHATDFYVSGFDPAFNYIVVDNLGEEYPVINKSYRPFVEDDKVWKLGAEGSGNPVQLVEYLYFDGDTIIGGKTCKQMMRQRYVNHDYAESHNISQDHSLSYVGAWYEEDQKVYIYDSINNQFKLMYDFSLDANDILENDNLSYVIGPKQSGGIKGFKGVHRDVWMLRDGRKVYSTPWLEGVGGVYGPTINVIDGELEDPACFLMACYVGDEVIYLNDACEDGATPAEARKQRIDFTHTTKIKPKARSKQEESDACISSSERDVARPKVKTRTEVKTRSEEEQSLYGEYNERKLDINLDPLSDAYQVCITDESGNAVYGKAINAGNIVGLNIDISSYPKGHYTVTVENDEELFIGEFETQTAGIEVVRSERIEARGFIYNLQGQRLRSLQKGLNIVNGQKVYVK